MRNNIFFIFALLLLIGEVGCERVIYQNDTSEPCPECPICSVCKPCAVCPPRIAKAEDKPQVDRQSEIIKSYAQCLRNVSDLQSQLDLDCIIEWQHCNDTLRDYTDRLNNISYYSTKNR